MPGDQRTGIARLEWLESRMTGNRPVRFGGRPTEKAPPGDLAGGRSYWRPVHNILEGNLTVLVVNAPHIKALPGRKTDLKDGEWIADLLRHGLVRGSFVPDRAQRDLRELTRYRTALVRERTAETNRLHKTLESGNIKLGAVVSDLRGQSARAMLTALARGTTDAQALAQWARAKLRAKIPQLEEALTGRVRAHHRFLVAAHLAHIDHLDETVEVISAEIMARFSAPTESPAPVPSSIQLTETQRQAIAQRASEEIGRRLPSLAQALDQLQTIPGVGQRTAEVLIAELGVDMSRFPTAQHAAAWAGMCPGNHESAGKRLRGTTRQGSPWLRSVLVEAAQAAARSKDNDLAAQFHRLVPRLGKKKAIVAVAHSILIIAYHLLKKGTSYSDLGAHYFDQRERDQVRRRLVPRLEHLGYQVNLEPLPATG
jgi:transposase